MQEKFEKSPTHAQLKTQEMLEAVKGGQAPFITNEKGVFPNPVRSASSGKLFKGTNQLIAQTELAKRGLNDSYLITYDQAIKAGTFIKKGEKAIQLSTYDAKKNESKIYTYFPLSAADNPAKIDVNKSHESLRDEKNKIVCYSGDPEKYLTEYLKATTLNQRFTAPPNIVEQFKSNFANEIEKGIEEKKHTHLFALGNRASVSCRSELKAMFEKERSIKEKEKTEQIRQAPYKKPITLER